MAVLTAQQDDFPRWLLVHSSIVAHFPSTGSSACIVLPFAGEAALLSKAIRRDALAPEQSGLICLVSGHLITVPHRPLSRAHLADGQGGYPAKSPLHCFHFEASFE
jgi:hypothetical protein